MPVKLYISHVSPNSRKARAVARHIGIEHDEVIVDLKAGEQNSKDFLALNPNGLVPVLVDGKTVLFESNAIAYYLADKGKSDLLPPGAAARADVVKWLSWEGWHLAHPVLDLAFERVIKPMLKMGPPDESIVKKSLEGFARFGGVLNGELGKREWVAGSNLTIADFCLGACFTFATPSGLPLEQTPHVRRWLQALDELPAWRDTAPPQG